MQAPTTHNITQALSIYENPPFECFRSMNWGNLFLYQHLRNKENKGNAAPALATSPTTYEIPVFHTRRLFRVRFSLRLRSLSTGHCVQLKASFPPRHLKFSLSQFDSREIRNKIEFFFIILRCCCWPSTGKTKWFPNWFPFLKRHQNDWWREIKYYHRLRNPSRVFFFFFFFFHPHSSARLWPAFLSCLLCDLLIEILDTL